MSVEARHRLARLLTSAAPADPPCIQLNAEVSDLRLDVDGVGPVDFPVSARQARKLVELGSPARFGRGEQTLTDPQVRDTWEIPAGLVHTEWTEAFASILSTVGDWFRLPASGRLRADFHSLLVYQPGQFFLPHQDSEKHDGMIGTLVVTLPSSYTGGELVIHHGGESRTHRALKSELALVAFHADRRHEVRPVKSGHRVALTYNLTADDETGIPVGDDGAHVEELAGCLAEHFATGIRHPYRSETGPPPGRLVYLLDHEYTEHGLVWSRLKGPDRSRGFRLRAAASQAGCEIALALVDVQENWNAWEPELDYGRRYRYGSWDDEDEPDDRPADGIGDEIYELQELIESSVTLTHWVDEDDTVAGIALSVDEPELCASTATVDLRPQSSEYQGYMGNYGNTLDRWYRRAAVVIWPREQSFATRAEAAPTRALRELLTRVESGDVAGARVAAATLEPLWRGIAVRPHDRGLFGLALQVADALDDPRIAGLLVRAFHLEGLRASNVVPFATLTARYGDAWLADVLGTWFGRTEAYSLSGAGDRMDWVRSLPELCRELHTAGDAGTTTACHLAGQSWESLRGNLVQALQAPSPAYREERLTRLGSVLGALLTAVAAGADSALREEVATFCRAQEDEVVACLMPALRTGAALDAHDRREGGLDGLAADAARRLRARLAQPIREDGDWSIALPDGCTCELCLPLGAFLQDPGRRVHEWPLAEPRRRHVHARIDGSELPVTHQTRRTGRPYTLVLTKTPALFERERRARRRDGDNLEWLTAEWKLL